MFTYGFKYLLLMLSHAIGRYMARVDFVIAHIIRWTWVLLAEISSAVEAPVAETLVGTHSMLFP